MRFLKFPTAALVSLAICFSPTAAAAEACQAGPGGCVLPIAEAPPPPPIVNQPVVGAPIAARGFNILPFLLAGAALIALLAILLSDGGDEEPASP